MQPKTLVGRPAGKSGAVQIDYSSTIEMVDELIRTPESDDLLAPGFVDLQVNGFAGVDYNDPASTTEQIAHSIQTMFSTGVTRFFPTVITGSEERMTGSVRNLFRAKEELRRNGSPEGHAMEAFHMEGPHLSPETGPRGAHPLEQIRPPSIDEFHRWQEAAGGMIRLVTVSPEWDETPHYIEELVRAGVVASIGHTKASAPQIQAAICAGATMSTHLGNAAHPTLPKTDNYILEQLADDRLAASFIADGIHIPPVFLQVALRTKGLERSILVTDAVMPAMCAPGAFRLGQVDVELRDDGSVVLLGGTRLAGSALRMDHAVANIVRMTGIPLRAAIAMASTNPARVGRVAYRQKGFAPGERADFVRFAWDDSAKSLAVKETIVAGSSVYNA